MGRGDDRVADRRGVLRSRIDRRSRAAGPRRSSPRKVLSWEAERRILEHRADTAARSPSARDDRTGALWLVDAVWDRSWYRHAGSSGRRDRHPDPVEFMSNAAAVAVTAAGVQPRGAAWRFAGGADAGDVDRGRARLCPALQLGPQYDRLLQRLPSYDRRGEGGWGHDAGVGAARRRAGLGLVAPTWLGLMSLNGATLWFTGLPSSGKSTIAREVFQRLLDRGLPAELLDGAEVRESLSRGPGFARGSRGAHPASATAKLLSRNGVIAICAAVSRTATARRCAGTPALRGGLRRLPRSR